MKKHENEDLPQEESHAEVAEVAELAEEAPAEEPARRPERKHGKIRAKVREYYREESMAPAWATLRSTYEKWKEHWKLFVGVSLLGAGAMGLVAVVGGAAIAGVAVSAGVFQNAASAAAFMTELLQRPAVVASLVSGAVILGAVMLVLSTWMALAQIFAWRWVASEEHHEMSIRNAYRASWSLVPSYIWISILSTLLVVAGLVAFLIPGLILALCFAVLPAVAVVENRKGMGAIRRAIAVVRPHLLGTLWRIAVAAVVLYLPASIIFGIVGSIVGEDIGNALDNLWGFIVSPIFAGVVYATFMELKGRVHGTREEGWPLLKVVAVLAGAAVLLGVLFAVAGIL